MAATSQASALVRVRPLLTLCVVKEANAPAVASTAPTNEKARNRGPFRLCGADHIRIISASYRRISDQNGIDESSPSSAAADFGAAADPPSAFAAGVNAKSQTVPTSL